jgi:hypothetical protein
MITRSLKKYQFFLFVLAMLLSCQPQLNDDQIPLVPFEPIVLNVALPSYSTLQSIGGYKELSSGGTRGIILYRLNTATILAFERNCSFQPQDACATVNVHPSGLFMNDACCGSTFRFDNGNPSGGAAWRPLVQYNTSLIGNTLTITDQTIN